MSFPSISALLPHTPPMVLLDEVVEQTGDAITCRVTVREQMPFLHGGAQRGTVCIEYMAQAAAAFAGLSAIASGERPRVGYVVGVRRMKLQRSHLYAGQQLLVTARMTWRDQQTAAFSCRVDESGEAVAVAELTVVDPGQPV